MKDIKTAVFKFSRNGKKLGKVLDLSARGSVKKLEKALDLSARGP